MKIHKMYACEYCDKEFDEADPCLDHEKDCDYRQDKKRCASCGHGTPVVHYEEDMIRCIRRKCTWQSCEEWKGKQ